MQFLFTYIPRKTNDWQAQMFKTNNNKNSKKTIGTYNILALRILNLKIKSKLKNYNQNRFKFITLFADAI